MRFDLHLRQDLKSKVEDLARRMSEWEERPPLGEEDRRRLRDVVVPFDHATVGEDFIVGGVDGSGDFPSVSYADSFVHVAVAQGVLYSTDARTGLRETESLAPLVEMAWLPEEEERRQAGLDAAFAALAGRPLEEVVERSDYRVLKTRHARAAQPVAELVQRLIRPHAADMANLGIQLRSTAELGAALRLVERCPRYVLTDGTLSLPLVTRSGESLFFEHLKRLCCVEALEKGVGFLALSKSHGVRSVELVEELAAEKLGLAAEKQPEHWYLRIPVRAVDEWETPLVEGRTLPPVGAMTYLVRLHRSTPVMRLDVDLGWWRSRIRCGDEAQTRANEQRLFQDLDRVSHDQRCFGYPYPIKAGHDRASLSEQERLVLRRQIVDAAVRAGLKPALFRSASKATRHD
jgi:hypothetical protein